MPAATYRGPVLPAAAPVSPDAPIIVQHGSRNTVKEAPFALWEALLPLLAERAPVMLVGSAGDRARFAPLRAPVPAHRLHDAMGATSFAELGRLTGRARAAVGAESMVAHLAVGHARPTVVLTNPDASGIVAFPRGCSSVPRRRTPSCAPWTTLRHTRRR